MCPVEDLEVTQILNNSKREIESIGDVYEILYRDIKRMASYQLSKLPTGATITPTVLAHEAYERIYESIPKGYENRTHFLRSLGQVMRNFLIDQMRSQKSLKHGERAENYTISEFKGEQDVAYDILELNNALIFISEIDPKYTEILELKLLFGFTFDEAATITGTSSRQLQRRWTQAKAILISVLADQQNTP